MKVDSLIPTASRSPSAHVVKIGHLLVGGATVPVIAGPCSVEPGYVEHAVAMADAGAHALRGSIYKPRTRPGDFQGIGLDGVVLLDEARARTSLPIIAEPLSVEHIHHLEGHVDALQIGARSMQNTPLLRAAGRSGMTVILKRGLAATYDEWLSAADYVLGEGNDQLILCERGIRTFETATRGTLDISAIPVMRERTDLPIIVDPSHAAGNPAWVASLAMAAVAAGADGLLIEAHPDPDAAWSDARQVITPSVLASVVRAVKILSGSVRHAEVRTHADCRAAIDGVDGAIASLIEQRAILVDITQQIKSRSGNTDRDPVRESEIAERMSELAPRLGRDGAQRVMRVVIDACLDAAAKHDEAIPA